MASDTRDRILQSANTLFYRDGFHAVGLEAILADVGVTKTTFYNHFESKDDLVLEVLRWHDEWWQNTFRELLIKHGGDTPRGQLEAVFDAFDELFQSDDFNGCIFINVSVEFPLPHHPAHLAAATHKSSMEKIVRELAGYAGATDAIAFAQELSLIMEGAYVTRQVSRNDETSIVAKRLASLLFEKYLPELN